MGTSSQVVPGTWGLHRLCQPVPTEIAGHSRWWSALDMTVMARSRMIRAWLWTVNASGGYVFILIHYSDSSTCKASRLRLEAYPRQLLMGSGSVHWLFSPFEAILESVITLFLFFRFTSWCMVHVGRTLGREKHCQREREVHHCTSLTPRTTWLQ